MPCITRNINLGTVYHQNRLEIPVFVSFKDVMHIIVRHLRAQGDLLAATQQKNRFGRNVALFLAHENKPQALQIYKPSKEDLEDGPESDSDLESENKVLFCPPTPLSGPL